MRWILPAVLAAALVPGCGQSASRDDVRAVTDRFYAAVADDDGATACAQLTEQTLKQLEQDEKATCAQAVGDLGLAPARIARVEVYITNAKVDLANGASAYLEQTAHGWRISALGCRATEGDPEDQPQSCAAES
jgi:hypothetical protein